MNILHIIYSLELGGAETMLIDIANAQRARGDKVAVLIVNDEVNDILLRRFDPGVEIIRMRRRRGDKALLMMIRLNMLLLRRRPDAIHAHHHKFGRLVQVLRNRMVLTIHNIGAPMIYCARTRMVAISDAVRQDVLARVPDAEISVVTNGIRVKDFSPRGDAAAHKPLRIVQLGRLNSDIKGQDILIRAIGSVKCDAHVTFIGEGPDKEMLGQLAVRAGVADKVTFAGAMPHEEICRRLADFDVMVHPSRCEGFGLIVAEAMAAGLPVIVTENDGPWEVADRGRLCLSAPVGDHTAFAEKIDELNDNYGTALGRARQALEYVRKYDIEATVDAYYDIYRRR